MIKKISLGMVAAFAVILVAGILPTAIWYASPWQAWQPAKEGARSPLKPRGLHIARVNDQSFGKLTLQNAAPAGAPSRSAVGMGGGGFDAGATTSEKMAILPAPDFKNYRFVYKGEEFAVDEKNMAVLKRTRPVEAAVDVQSLLAGLDFGLVDFASLPDLRLQNLSLVERKDFGYSVSASLDEGSVSIMQNWEAWPAGKCGGDQACYDAQRVRLGDILPDADAIKIADDFMAAHRIDRSLYGAPEILNTWRTGYEAAQNKTDYYLPETVEVVYPLNIDGRAVFDEYNGWRQGLTVSVHNKTRRVASVYGLTTQAYTSSAYEVETDTNKLLAYAEKGGFNSYPMEGAKTEELALGTPELGFIRYYNYQNGATVELLVPALSFPVMNPPANDPNFFRKAVVLPLAKDILAEREAAGPPILLKETVSASSTD